MKFWVLSTCVPGENEPCMPRVFVSEKAAQTAFDETIRGEWDSFGEWNDDGPQEWPGDARKAHEIMAKTPLWGGWEITTHHLDLHLPSPTFVPENEHGVKPGYYTKPDIVRLLRKHHTNPKAVHFIADMME